MIVGPATSVVEMLNSVVVETKLLVTNSVVVAKAVRVVVLSSVQGAVDVSVSVSVEPGSVDMEVIVTGGPP